MKLSMYTVSLKKKYPLQISRGIKDQSVNVFLKIKEGNFTAWGESAPGKSENAGSAEIVKEHLQNFILTDIKSKSRLSGLQIDYCYVKQLFCFQDTECFHFQASSQVFQMIHPMNELEHCLL